MKKIVLSLILGFGFLFGTQEINVYTYHNHAPFITDKKVGLSYDLIDHLNKNANGKYIFILKVIPRNRLNYTLKPWINKKCGVTKKCASNWMVLWVNPKWGFGKDSMSNFSWTSLFEDSNIIISSKQNHIEYSSPHSLIGKKLAGISGHKYVGIDELVNQGKITRINGNNETLNLKKVLSSRVDVTLLPNSSFKYYQKKDISLHDLKGSNTAHQRYMRNIMTTTKNTELIDFLQSQNFTTILKEYAK
mgnify:CR=1 FL=1